MEKKKLTLTTLFLAAFLVTGITPIVTAQPYVYDKSVPMEKSCTIHIAMGAVTKFNGVKTGTEWWYGVLRAKAVIIPAGKHTLELTNGSEADRGDRIESRVDSRTLTYEFLPGHTYSVFAITNAGSLFKKAEFITKIIDIGPLELIPDPTHPDATPLEGKWENTKKKTQIIISGDMWIWVYSGKYTYRGSIIVDGDKVTLTILAQYQNGIWALDRYLTWGQTNVYKKLTFDGTRLFDKKDPFEKTL